MWRRWLRPPAPWGEAPTVDRRWRPGDLSARTRQLTSQASERFAMAVHVARRFPVVGRLRRTTPRCRGARRHRAGATGRSCSASGPAGAATTATWNRLAGCESGGELAYQHRQRVLRGPAVLPGHLGRHGWPQVRLPRRPRPPARSRWPSARTCCGPRTTRGGLAGLLAQAGSDQGRRLATDHTVDGVLGSSRHSVPDPAPQAERPAGAVSQAEPALTVGSWPDARPSVRLADARPAPRQAVRR